MIAKGDVVVKITEEGSLRRCGGQGDVVAGVMGVMNLWSSRRGLSEVDAASATSTLVRRAANKAFVKEKRRMTAVSIVEELSNVIDSLFGICYKHMRREFHQV